MNRLVLLASFVSALMFCGAAALAQQTTSLLDKSDPKSGWTFDNGREFKGATGTLTADPDNKHDGHASLKLAGDFTAGGMYVQAGKKLDKLDFREISLWVKNPDSDTFTLRLGDASGQTHQIVLRTEPGDQWQQVTLPLEKFFKSRGQADAVTNVAKYESWGGAKDSNWHGPATGIYIITGKPNVAKTRTFWIGDITVTPRPAEVAGAEQKIVIPLDEVVEGNHDWSLSLGDGKGAKGSLTVEKDGPAAGQTALKLAADFTGGGVYVAAIKNLKDLDVKDVTAFRLQAKTANAATMTIQVVDSSGQTHQRKGVKLQADNAWHEMTIKPTEIAGGEHWGGANDSKWHGPPQRLVLSLTASSDSKGKQPVLELAEIRADALLPVFVQPAAYKEDFERVVSRWESVGKFEHQLGANGANSASLERSLENVNQPATATGPAFPASAGQWQIGFRYRANLHSPDNSYNAAVQIECLDSAGKSIAHVTAGEVFGKQEDWKSVSQRIELPNGTSAARFLIQLNKTYGRFDFDDLSASMLAPPPRRDDRIAKLLFSTARLGNLLFPEDPRKVDITVECRKPLRDDQHTLNYVVRDYWGAEQIQPATVALGKPEKKGDRLVYAAAIDLTPANLELGRYYEVLAWIGQAGEEPFRNHTSLAILPEAVTRKFKAEEIPFSSRSWDNRSAEYMRLADRLGYRICGVWGGWSAKPPYKPEAPGLDLVKELGMGWLTNTPIATIERGKTDYSQEALRQGVRNLIEKYGQHQPMIINLGNEPHGTGDVVRRNVEAYKTVYEEVKKVDPKIPVVATSVEPNEEYFKLGYGKYCDAFDFHIYETAESVRQTMREYKALMKKYGVEKALWSTELGLNSQGMTRHVVAVEVFKKFTSFFAEGGTSVSWFGFLYPDPEGKNEGSSGQAHNIFDSRFNHYCPKLDAVAVYNAINSISIKKFVGEKQYENGVHAFLFRDRDGHTLQVLWMEKDRADVAIPLAGVKQVEVIRVDGSRRMLNAGEKSITLSVTTDPVLLLYDGGSAALPEALAVPAAKIEAGPKTASKRQPIQLTVAAGETPADQVSVVAPPFWKVQRTAAAAGKIEFTLMPPTTTEAHHADITVRVGDRGVLYWRAPLGE